MRKLQDHTVTMTQINDDMAFENILGIHRLQHGKNQPLTYSKCAGVLSKAGIDDASLEAHISHAICRVQTWIQKNNGIVGHIKVLLEGTSLICASATGSNVNIRHVTNHNFDKETGMKLYFTAVAMQVEYQGFTACCEEAYEACLEQCFENVEIQ